MPGVGVNDRDDPVLGHFRDDAERPVVANFKVLADHGRQRLCRRATPGPTAASRISKQA